MSFLAEHGVSLDVNEAASADDALRKVVGIAAIIIPIQLAEFADGQIKFLTVLEKEKDTATGKFPGERGLIQEKIRVEDTQTLRQESPLTTLQRALYEEVLGDEGVRDVGHHFQRVVFERGRPEGPMPSIGQSGGIEVVFYTGSVAGLIGHAAGQSEVGSPRFDTVASFSVHPKPRQTSIELLHFTGRAGLLTTAVDLFRAGQTESVFPGQFQPGDLAQTRSARPDMIRLMGR